MTESADPATDRSPDNPPIGAATPEHALGTPDGINFTDLALPEPLINATTKAGFVRCTDVQAVSMPQILNGHDVAAQAQTGTGKTAAFLLGGMSVLLSRGVDDTRAANQPRMLVIAPTRELALQIRADADQLGEFTGLRTCVAHGGADYEKQRTEIGNGVDILVGTPGRLIDYFKKRVFDLRRLEIAVLDEADRMFDLGFISDIRFLLRRMPKPEARMSMLFSATLSNRVLELAYEHMNNPKVIKAGGQGVTAEKVRQRLFHPASDEKVALLLGLLKQLDPPRSIVFVNTRRAAEQVEGYLKGNGHDCGTLSGDVRQKKRQKILASFTEGRLPILIATDVAARGLHIDDVTHVFNFDLPQQAEDYVHRIGRTARAGSDGEAISFACEEYSYSLPEILEYIGTDIPFEAITSDLLETPAPPVKLKFDRPRDFGKSSKTKRQPRKSRQQHKPVTSTENKTADGDEGKKPRRRRRRRKPATASEQTSNTTSR